MDPITLTKGDLDEISDKVHDTIIKLLQQFEKQYMKSLGNVQKDLCKLQIQTSWIQAGTSQVSATQMTLALGTCQVAKLVRTMDLRIIALPEGSLSAESTDDKIIISTLKNISLNIAALPNEFLHALQTGVTMKFRAREQRNT